jgi:integrase
MIDFERIVADVAKASEFNGTRETTRLDNLALSNPSDEVLLLDRCGRQRSPATLRSFRLGKKPGNAGNTYKPRHLTHDEIGRLLAACKDNPAGRRGRALFVLQWRSGLRIMEALNLQRHDLDRDAGTVFVEHGKGNKSGIVGMDEWAWEQIAPWLDYRYDRYPPGPVFCVVQGPTKGGRWSESGARTFYHQMGRRAEIAKRIHPHIMRHTFAVDLDREGHSLTEVQRSLRHSDPGTTGRYLVSISNASVIKKLRGRAAPVLTNEELVSA